MNDEYQDTHLPFAAPSSAWSAAAAALTSTSPRRTPPLTSLASSVEPPPKPSNRYPLACAKDGPRSCSMYATSDPANSAVTVPRPDALPAPPPQAAGATRAAQAAAAADAHQMRGLERRRQGAAALAANVRVLRRPM